MHVHDELREHILCSTGTNLWTPDLIKKWNWCLLYEHLATPQVENEEIDKQIKEFIGLCKNRMMQGFFRYGSAWGKGPTIKYFDSLALSISRRMLEYQRPPKKNNPSHRNKEHLVDVWNLLMCLFITNHTEDYTHNEQVEPKMLPKHVIPMTLKTHMLVRNYTMADAQSKFRWYQSTLDSRYLTDVAVFCVLEYICPTLRGTHMRTIGEHNYHVDYK